MLKHKTKRFRTIKNIVHLNTISKDTGNVFIFKIYCRLFFIIVLNCIAVFKYSSIYSDTVITSNGMILVGKVIEKNSESLVFSNMEGVFQIDRNIIVELHLTKNSNQDIQIIKNFKSEIDEQMIRKNIEAGEQYQKKINSEKHRRITGIGVQSFYYYNVGSSSKDLKNGYEFTAVSSFDLFLSQNEIYPEIIFEIGYFSTLADSIEISGFNFSTGLFWDMIFYDNSFSLHGIFNPTIGCGYFDIVSYDDNSVEPRLITGVATGLSLNKTNYEFELMIKYRNIYNGQKPVNFLGVGLGVNCVF
ncbi:MAG: hypothetical protein JXR90_17655 [Spirochaetes bacterium]|nr:hypothetical protein [Spirochaetota bacterium]